MSGPLGKVPGKALSPVKTLALLFGNVLCLETRLGISERTAAATAGFSI